MATMDYNGTTYTVKYVDPTASGANDGTTVTDALTTLPGLASISAATAYIIRRTAFELSLTPATATQQVLFIGCPFTTDNDNPFRDIVPAAVITAWGGDAATKAIILTSSTSSIILSAANNVFANIELRSTASAGNTTTGTIQQAIEGLLLFNVKIVMKGKDYGDATPRGTDQRVPLQFQANNLTIINSEIQACNNTNWIVGPSGVTAANWRFVNTVFKQWVGTPSPTLGPTGITNAIYNLEVEKCSFLVKGQTDATISTGSFQWYFPNCRVRNSSFAIDVTTVGRGSNAVLFTSSTALRDMQFENCTFSDIAASAATGLLLFTSFSSTFFINCTFTVSNFGTATSSTATCFSSCTRLFVKGCTFNIGTAAPLIAAATGTFDIFDSNTITSGSLLQWDTRNKINAVNASNYTSGTTVLSTSTTAMNPYLYIPTLTMVAGKQIDLNTGGKVFIDSCNIAPLLSFATSESAYYCANENGVTGNWHSETLNNKITVNTSNRTGGGAFSYKCEGKSANSTANWLYIAPHPFTGIPITGLTTGKRTVTMYIAYKNYTINGRDDLVLEVEIPDAGSGTGVKKVNSHGQGRIESDSSTWNGDTGLTVRKIVVIFDLLRSETIYARILYNKFASSAYVYVDPVLVGA